MISFFTFILCLIVGMIALLITALSTAYSRKRWRIGPRAFQARLATPVALSLGCLFALAITQIPSLQAASDLIGSLLLTVLLASTLTLPFAIISGIFLLVLTGWANVFAAIAIVSAGVAIGHVVGYRWASPSSDRDQPQAVIT